MKIEFRTPKATDGSIKYRFQVRPNQFVEALYFNYHDGLKVLCLSTQVGCDMGCCFCGTGKQKKVTNLTQEEIVQQAKLIVDDIIPGQVPDTITLAGMGEPLANYEASIGALREFQKIYGNIRLSLSTVGLKQKLKQMVHEKCHFGVYLSMHSSDEKIRQEIMPSAANNSLKELTDLLQEYAKINTPETVRISYLMLKGITDSDDQLKKLIKLVKGKDFRVQFRLWNSVEGIDLASSPIEVVKRWVENLEKEGINACIRPSAGQEILGACGQMQVQNTLQKIIPVGSFHEIFQETINSKTLLIVDIDSTLIVPQNPILHPQFFSQYKDIVKRLYQNISSEEKHFLNHSIIAQPSMIVEPYSVEWLQTMQKKQIPMIALTAAKQGRFDNSNRNFHEIRFEQLKQLGIDFSIPTFPDRQFTSLQPTCNDYPSLKKGILYSCGLHNTKGAVLEAFLDKVNGIERVVVIDDKRKHLESIATMLKEKFPKWEFSGFQYKRADLLTPEVIVSKEEFETYLSALINEVKKLDWIKQ